tara:strand:+ start:169 stop:732 length:564 start_codon:yes stop_codon:yes gene_type:complete
MAHRKRRMQDMVTQVNANSNGAGNVLNPNKKNLKEKRDVVVDEGGKKTITKTSRKGVSKVKTIERGGPEGTSNENLKKKKTVTKTTPDETTMRSKEVGEKIKGVKRYKSKEKRLETDKFVVGKRTKKGKRSKESVRSGEKRVTSYIVDKEDDFQAGRMGGNRTTTNKDAKKFYKEHKKRLKKEGTIW